jgi:hypothetical protein
LRDWKKLLLHGLSIPKSKFSDVSFLRANLLENVILELYGSIHIICEVLEEG